MNLAASLEIHAAARPDHPALIEGDRVIDHAGLAAAVRCISGRFAAAGIRRGDVVGICLRDTVEHLEVNYALARMGAIILPMDWRWTRQEKLSVAGHFKAQLIIVEDDEQAVGDLAISTLGQLPESAPGFDAVGPVGDGELPLLLSLSSGTTGRPKGPCITHGQMLRRFWTHWINLGLNSTDRYVSATPLYFGGGRTFAMSVLYSGGTVILFPPPFDVEGLVAEIVRTGATSTFLVPTQLRRMLEGSDAQKAAMRTLRLLISSGAPLDPVERGAIGSTLNANFVEYYASTEGGGVSLATPQTRLRSPDSVGRPVFGVEVQCVSDDHIPLPSGETGQLRYRGPGVASGYFGEDPDEESPFRDGWFYPGDLAAIDGGGHVELRGRRKDVIIRGGVNIYPAEIEQTLRGHPQVAEAAVVAAPAGKLGETVAAFVVTRTQVDGKELIDWCSTRLASYKVPAFITMIDELPRNSAGKVLKANLQQTLKG